MVSQDENVSVKAQKTSSASSPSRATHSREAASGTPTRPPIFSPPQSKLTKALNSSPSPSKQVLPGLERIVAQCWKFMLDEGWETMTQADGRDLYKMPGISFFNFRPNENVFDSLVKACNKYLRDWTREAHEDESEQSRLMDFLWPMVEKSGWVKISSSNETWYMMPNTAFNECVPNVTIFRSKALAISKYLEASGVLQVEDTHPQAKETDSSVSSSSSEAAKVDNQEIDEDMEVDESEEDDESASEDSSSEVEDESVEENNDERLDESEEEEVVVVQAKTKSRSKNAPSRTKRTKSVQAVKPKAAPKAPTVVPQRELPSPTPAKKLKFSKPRATIPPFKVTFGKIESELRERGWYWKPSSGDWRYFKPSCRLQEVSALKPNVDYFDSRSTLEDYLDLSGLYDEIRMKLRREHEARYAQSSDSEDDDEEVSEDDEEEVLPKQKQVSKPNSVPAPPLTLVSQRPSSNNDDEASKENRSANVMPGRRRKMQPPVAATSFSSSRRGHSLMSLNATQAKFGDIWAALVKQGWHLKSGKFEYDYFKPHCQDANEGVPNVDYFPSKDMLVMYLQSSGIWEKTAKKLARDDAIDLTSSDDDDKEPEPVSKHVSKRQALFKRKSNVIDCDSDEAVDERTPTGKSAKKKKVAGTFSTPTEQKRSASDIVDDGHESDMGDKISPDTGVQKAAVQDNSTSSSLPRNLANCFTPSPGTLKKSKSSSMTSEQNGPLKLFTDAIQNLTLGYSSSKFKYRDDESRRIHDFFQTCFTEQHGSSMYISGAPGCGKSALLKASENRITQMYQVRSILLLALLVVSRELIVFCLCFCV